jgi:hypothetical protein
MVPDTSTKTFDLGDERLSIETDVEQNLHGGRAALGNGHVERRVVVDAALIRVGAERQQQAEDIVDIHPPGRAGHVARAAQRRNQRREPVVSGSIGVGADPGARRSRPPPNRR